MSWWVYLLRCGDGTSTPGSPTIWTAVWPPTTRAGERNIPGAAAPVTLVWREEQPDKSAALRREYAVKQLTRAKKLALIEGGPLV